MSGNKSPTRNKAFKPLMGSSKKMLPAKDEEPNGPGQSLGQLKTEKTIKTFNDNNVRVRGKNTIKIIGEFNDHPEYTQYLRRGDVIDDMKKWKETHLPDMYTEEKGMLSKLMTPLKIFSTSTLNPVGYTYEGVPLNELDMIDQEIENLIQTPANKTKFSKTKKDIVSSILADELTQSPSPNSKEYRALVEKEKPKVFINEYPRNFSTKYLDDIPDGYGHFWYKDRGASRQLVIYDKSDPTTKKIFGDKKNRQDIDIENIPVYKTVDLEEPQLSPSPTKKELKRLKSQRKHERNQARKPQKLNVGRHVSAPAPVPVISATDPENRYRRLNLPVNLNKADLLDDTDYHDVFMKSKQAYADYLQSMKDAAELIDPNASFGQDENEPELTQTPASDANVREELKQLLLEVINSDEKNEPVRAQTKWATTFSKPIKKYIPKQEKKKKIRQY